MPKLENTGKLRQISLDQIVVTDNVRTEFSDIEELAASIQTVGLLEPILVKALGKSADGLDEYELVAGDRRRRAFLYLRDKGEGYTMIDAIVTTGDKLTLQLVENLQRSDLSPRDREAGIRQLSEAGVSNKEIAARLSKSEPFVSRNLTAYKVRDVLVQEALAGIKKLEADIAAKGDNPPSWLLGDLKIAQQWLVDINGLSTQALCEIQGVKKDALISMSRNLIAGGGTVSCARQLMRNYNTPQKEAPLAEEAEAGSEPEITKQDTALAVGDNIDPLADNENTTESNDDEPSLPAPASKASSSKKPAGQAPARVLEEPPHKKVNLNSVQAVIRDYIENISKAKAGYEFEYKTDAGYEIWSLLLAELAGL